MKYKHDYAVTHDLEDEYMKYDARMLQIQGSIIKGWDKKKVFQEQKSQTKSQMNLTTFKHI